MLRTPIERHKQTLDDLRTLSRAIFYGITLAGLIWMVYSAVRTVILIHSSGGQQQ